MKQISRKQFMDAFIEICGDTPLERNLAGKIADTLGIEDQKPIELNFESQCTYMPIDNYSLFCFTFKNDIDNVIGKRFRVVATEIIE